jgi:SpoVK/Ycf46/Vps4 family AAA+-type ATPase
MVKRATSLKGQERLVRDRTALPVPERAEARSRSTPVKPPLGSRASMGQLLVPRGVQDAPVLDLMCSHFVLALAARQGPRFNVRRDLNSLLALTGRHLVWPLTVLQRLRTFLELRCRDNSLWAGQARLSAQAFVERFGVWQGPYEEGTLFFHLDEYAKECPKDVLAVLAATGEWLSRGLERRQTLLEKNLDELAGLLHLNRAERALLLYGTLARYQRELRSILVEFKVNNAPEAFAAMAEVAGVEAAELGEALRAGSRLERIGLLDNLLSEHNITDLADLMKVSERIPPVLMRAYRDRSELMAVFTRPATRSTLGVADFDFAREDVQVLCTLLREAVARQEPGVNVLIYGPPGTGKTELARVAAQTVGLELFEVEYADRDGHSLSGRDRYRSLQIAQVFLKGTAQSVLLFDEVEDVFPPLSSDLSQRMARADLSGPASSSVSGKAWVNQMLETNPVPTLWVTNRIEQIDPAFRRRFAYHMELKSPPPGARETLVRRTLEGEAVSDELVARLTERPGLTPAQIRTAVRFARLVKTDAVQGVGAGTAMDALIERQLRQADHALGRRSDAPSRHNAMDYGLHWLHLDARYDLPRTLAALRTRGHGTLCFHGPPGSGKTALAEHLAHELQRPLMVRQASDLMSKFVGETEQQMAAMFAEAEAEKAVLLLDEADSFLLDRRGAQRHHEVSEVNEMLQGMERFRGIFICTTNLLDRMDAAALRRFTFKIRFLPLRPEQREALFVHTVLGPGHGSAWPELLPQALRQRLRALDALCLGDFAAVKRQCDILQETLSPEAFLQELESEHRLKPEVREHRPIGFTGFTGFLGAADRHGPEPA